MAIRVWDPFTALAQLDEEFDGLVRRAWGNQVPTSGTSYIPAVDVRVEDADVVIRLELPGVDVEKDVDIEVADSRLTISGERRERAETKGKHLVRELRYGAFRRDFALPDGVSADQVTAAYDGGMLEVRVRAVVRPAQQPRKVTINRGGDATSRAIQNAE
jgi:HSP20 family protein